MKVLLDTNVLSEVRRPAPEPKVLAWLDTIDEDRAFISVASIAELRRGIAADGGRPASRHALAAWLAVDLPARFCGANPADRSGDRRALGRRHGAGPPEAALRSPSWTDFSQPRRSPSALVLATRNTKDFAPLGVPLFNPWTDESETG